MKKWLSFLCAFALLASCVNIPTAHAADVLTEEKIELPGKALYRYTFDQDEQVFKCRGEVTEDAAYQVLTDGDYTTDAAIGQQTFVVLDLGKEYPISTIKAYQTGDNASNFVSVVEGFSGITDTFTRNDCGDLLRTNITSTSENGAKCYTKTELSSRSHRIGTYRYLLFYNWSTRLTLSEIELYQDTTTKTDALSVSNFYGDNMVLQREKNHVIKGYSATGETVQVTMTEDASSSNTETVTVNPDESGNWKAELPPMKAGMSPYTITISDGTSAPEIKLSNVLVGDVFLASGQSNMAYDAPKAADQRETQYNNIDGPNGAIYYKKGMFELQSAIASDKIRMFRMREDGQAESGVVTEDVPVWIDWCPSDGERLETSSLGVTTARRHKNILALSSLAAFFADRLAEETEIPVGIIQASRGGSAINIWSKKGRLYNNHIAPLDGLNIAGVLVSGLRGFQRDRVQNLL